MARIMIVDDAAFMRMMIRMMFVEAGHEVVGEASSGQEAIDMYAVLNPDLVTMDITMEGMDGINSVKGIMHKHPDAKIIMCSAMGQQQMILDAIEAGARDFIVKPFQRDRVLSALNKLIAN